MSPHVADEMKRLCMNCVPLLEDNLFQILKSDINIVHINVGGIYRKIDDIKQDQILQISNIISINETHLSKTDTLSPEMMNLTNEMEIFCTHRNSFGGGVALIVNKKFNPQWIHLDMCYEICAVIMHCTSEIVLISVYRPPAPSICQFTNEMSKLLSLFEKMNVLWEISMKIFWY